MEAGNGSMMQVRYVFFKKAVRVGSHIAKLPRFYPS